MVLPQEVPLLVADATNQESVDSVVGQADVVIGCAGPFELYGGSVVDASIRLGTHYCDITGLWCCSFIVLVVVGSEALRTSVLIAVVC